MTLLQNGGRCVGRVRRVGLPVRMTLLQNKAHATSSGALSWITSQDDTAPKPPNPTRGNRAGWITSQDDTAPKLGIDPARLLLVGLPVRITLLQNRWGKFLSAKGRSS